MQKINYVLLGLLLYSVNVIISREVPRIFHDAYEGNKQAVQDYLDNGQDCTIKNDNGDTILHIAAQQGYADIITLITDYYDSCSWLWYYTCGPTLPTGNEQNNSGDTPLHCAISSCKNQSCAVLLSKVTTQNLEITNHKGLTPLLLAVKKGDCATVKTIGEINPENYYAKKDQGKNILHSAIEEKHFSLIEQLAADKKFINAQDDNHLSPLHYAINNQDQCNQADNNAIARILIDSGADIAIYSKNKLPLLHDCILHNNLELFITLLNYNAKINEVDISGKTALHHAFEENKKEFIIPLLDKNSDSNKKNNSGFTVGHIAVQSRNIENLALLIEHPQSNFNINMQDNNKNTLLHKAVIDHNVEITNYLLNRKEIDITLCNSEGKCSFAIALDNNQDDLIDLISLHPDADINSKDNKGRTSLIRAAERGDYKGIDKILHNDKADISAADNFGDTALHKAAECGNKMNVELLIKKDKSSLIMPNNDDQLPLNIAISNKHEKLAILLVDAGSPINKSYYAGRTLLHQAAKHGLSQLTDYLLQKNAAITKDIDGWTPLHDAAANGHSVVIQKLRVHGEKITDLTNRNNSPLSVAIMNKHFECIKELLDQTIINKKNDKQLTVLHLAIHYFAPKKIIEQLLQSGADNTINDAQDNNCLHMAIESNNKEAFSLFVKQPHMINQKNCLGKTSLHQAAAHKRLSFSEELLKNGADIRLKNNNGETALMTASQLGDVSNIDLYMRYGAYVDEQDNKGFTVIAHAANIEIMKKLHKHYGASLSLRTNDRDTLLHLAAKRGDTQKIKYLMEQGLQSDDVNNKNEIPLISAVSNGHLDVVKLIIKDKDFITDQVTRAINHAQWGNHPAIVRFLNQKMEDRQKECRKIIDLHNNVQNFIAVNKNRDRVLSEKTSTKYPEYRYIYKPSSAIQEPIKNFNDIWQLDSSKRDEYYNALLCYKHHEIQENTIIEQNITSIQQLEEKLQKQQEAEKKQREYEKKRRDEELHAQQQEYTNILTKQDILYGLIASNRELSQDTQQGSSAAHYTYQPSSCAQRHPINIDQLKTLNSQALAQYATLLNECSHEEEKSKIALSYLLAQQRSTQAAIRIFTDKKAIETDFECALRLLEKKQKKVIDSSTDSDDTKEKRQAALKKIIHGMRKKGYQTIDELSSSLQTDEDKEIINMWTIEENLKKEFEVEMRKQQRKQSGGF
ncbi:MAG TPA: ankyrin repeat domain-containing protein [Candidatus Babeliales bacterium]|nr:ankyrin repeat domain-containing protein [Candidatus Babeliales bacterium]